MKRPFFKAGAFLLLAVGIFGLAFVLNQLIKDFTLHCTKRSSYTPYDVKDVTTQNSFVIIIPSYNNEEYVERNLRSVFEQQYSQYRVIYIDDCSTDGTYAKALECTQKFQKESKVTLIRNQKNQKALYNLYYAIHSARDNEIAVIVDGDDWLPTPHVLRNLNRYYNDENVWMTYGQYITYPVYARGKCRKPFLGALERGKVRKKPFFTRESDFLFSHLRTFYAGLFKRIVMKDLLYEGHFYPISYDLAIMLPMLEMAREHAVFIPEIMYVYNRENPLSDDKLRLNQQKFFDRQIRSLPAYPPLTEHPKLGIKEADKTSADLFVFSKDRPMQLFTFLESLYKHANHFDKIYVYYKTSDSTFDEGYKLLSQSYPNVIFHKDSKDGVTFNDFFANLFTTNSKEHIVFAEDQLVLKDTVDLKNAISLLEQTGAYGFFFHLGLNISELPPNLTPVGKSCFIWQFSLGQNDWGRSNNFCMSLYRKKDVQNYLSYMTFATVEELLGKWRKGLEIGGLGLCYSDSRVLELPMQVTRIENGEKILLYTEKQLNDRFLEGLKIDIEPLFQFQNREPAIEFYPLFIDRK